MNIAVLLGADPQLAEKEMQNVIDFEIRLSKVNYSAFLTKNESLIFILLNVSPI